VSDRARRLRPGIAIGADLIAGFPTETDELFAETLDFVTQADLPFLHVFPYSARPGTPAARMPVAPMATRRERAARLRAAGAAAAERFARARIGAALSVLTETEDSGHCAHFAPVRFTWPVAAGRIQAARAIGADAGTIIAEPI
jgi:threonylcarbamoyladenosine tRNA methylthiotransferase MtaB